ncbi:MAG: MBL fold metallo-hydrolase [Phycisphaeraceae bacterium]
MIRPIQQHDAFLADIAASKADPTGFRLWWLGQSGFLLQWAGSHALIDPYLSDSLTAKYASTDKPHTRMSEQVVDPARLGEITVVSSSHNHTDHLDAHTLVPLMHVNPQMTIVVPEANRTFVADRLKVDVTRLRGIDDGTTVHAGPFTFHGLPAAHDTLAQDERGHHKYMGYVIRFGPHAIYHSGDTLLYEGLVERLKPFNIDVALLPINGRAPERRVAGNLWGREAAQLAKAIGASVVIPCHYDMFEFNTATPDEFVAECEKIGQPYKVLQQGERWALLP